MEAPADSQGSPVQEATPVGEQPRMSPHIPVPEDFSPHLSSPRNLVSKVPQHAHQPPSSQEPQWLARNLDLKMSKGPMVPTEATLQANLQMHPGPARKLGLLFYPGIPIQPSLGMYPGPVQCQKLQAPASYKTGPGLQDPSSPQRSPAAGCGSLVFLVPSKSPGSQAFPNALGCHQKARFVFTSEQKLVLQKCFAQCMYPSKELCMALEKSIGIPQYTTKIWFKNQRARYKRENPQNLQKALPPVHRHPGAGDGSGQPRGRSPITASANVGLEYLSTSRLSSSSNFYPSLEASPRGAQAHEGAGYRPQEEALDGQGPAAADPGQPSAAEAMPGPAVAEGPDAAEAPVHRAAAARGPGAAQGSGPSVLEFCQRVLKDLLALIYILVHLHTTQHRSPLD